MGIPPFDYHQLWRVFAVVSGLLLVVVHSGEKLLAMDDDGFSDPYCIVTANKEKVRHVICTTIPSVLCPIPNS